MRDSQKKGLEKKRLREFARGAQKPERKQAATGEISAVRSGATPVEFHSA